jgi:hypothetical protein
MAIKAVQIWMRKAFSLVPTKLFTLRFCLSALKKSSISQRSGEAAIYPGPNGLVDFYVRAALEVKAHRARAAGLDAAVEASIEELSQRQRNEVTSCLAAQKVACGRRHSIRMESTFKVSLVSVPVTCALMGAAVLPVLQ